MEGFHQRIVFFRQLRGNAEMVRCKALEIGGIADEYAVLSDQIVLQICCSMVY